MSLPRIFQSISLASDLALSLSEQASHHVARVLRVKVGDHLVLFNGGGGEYLAKITTITKKAVNVRVEKFIDCTRESPLHLVLAQGVSRGEKMDFTIQKAVELGVKEIIPLLTERCNVKLDKARQEKRLAHWRSVIISACEQSGRNFIPTLQPFQELSTWLNKVNCDHRFILNPETKQKLFSSVIAKDASIVVLIGPEGGLSEKEIKMAESHQFTSLNLGPRVLRTETAAVAALTMMQGYFGDMVCLLPVLCQA